MGPLVAHGSGIDELIAFLSVPGLFLLWHLGRGVVRRVRRAGADDRDHGTSEVRPGPPPDA